MRASVELAKLLVSEAKQSTDETSKLLNGVQQLVANNEKVIHSLSDGKSIEDAISKDDFKDAIASKVSTKLEPRILAATRDVVEKINSQFKRLNTEAQNGYSFANTSTPNGAGYSPENPPGRCPIGSYVVGIQPLPIGAGGGGVRFLCALLPSLSIQPRP
jgi:hypothetical protein